MQHKTRFFSFFGVNSGMGHVTDNNRTRYLHIYTLHTRPDSQAKLHMQS